LSDWSETIAVWIATQRCILGFSIVIHALARPERGEAFTMGAALLRVS